MPKFLVSTASMWVELSDPEREALESAIEERTNKVFYDLSVRVPERWEYWVGQSKTVKGKYQFFYDSYNDQFWIVRRDSKLHMVHVLPDPLPEMAVGDIPIGQMSRNDLT